MTEPQDMTEAAAFPRLRRVFPFLLAGGLFLLGLSALYHLLAPVDVHQVVAQIRATPWNLLGLSLLTTLAGYLCLAGYDWSALRHIGKPLPGPVVLTGGLMAYAFGNTVGLTAISGGAVRWRIYSGLGLDGYDIAAISTFTSVSFGLAATVVGLGALTAHPGALTGILPLDTGQVRMLALFGLAAIIIPLVWASVTHKALRVGRFTLRAPTLPVLAGQVAISLGDICFSALTLYVFLPVTNYDFFAFLAVFAAATMAGILSHVPGGVGVFEAAIIATMPAGVPVDQVAAALLLYRLIYYLVPFILALLTLSGYEGWRAFGGRVPNTAFGTALAAVEPALRAVAPLAPLLLAAMTFGSGLWMSVSALLPPMTDAADAAERFFPLAFIEGSALITSALGAALIVLSLGVVRRSLGAFLLAQAAMVAGLVFALLQGDLEQSVMLVLVMVILLPFRSAFRRRAILTHAAMTPAWGFMLLAALAGFGFAFFIAHKSLPYASDLWWQFATDERAPRALRAGLLGSMMLGLGGIAMLLRAPRIDPHPPSSAELVAAATIAAAADDPNAGFALTGDKSLMFSDDGRAFIMFGISGGSWISFGPPVGPVDAAEDVAFAFVDAARRAGKTPVFYEVSPLAVPQMLDLGMTLHKMGEEAIIDLTRFSLDGPDRKKLRAAYARAGRDGLTLALTDPPHSAALINELRTISDMWLAAKGGREKGFSVGRFDPEWLGRWPLAIVRHNGRIVAFANILTTDSRNMGFIDLMRYVDDTPPGTMEFLFTSLMLTLKERGYCVFSLGMAPLSGLTPGRSGKLWDRFGALIYRHGGGFYNFAGLRAFKEKFSPDWRPRYFAASTALPPVLPLTDAARLIAGRPQKRRR